MIDERILTSEGRKSSDPEYTGAEQRLRYRMLEEQGRFSRQRSGVERIVHYHNDVQVIWLWLIGDERPEDDEPCKMTGASCQIVDSTEPLGDSFSRGGGAAEANFHFIQCCSMDSWRQVSGIPKPW